MIDLLKLSVPFKDEFLTRTAEISGRSTAYIDLDECSRRGLTMSARSYEYEVRGDLLVTGLSHPYTSLASSYTSLAFKIWQGASNNDAHIELKCSPAKLLQGHNVYGTEDLETCVSEMLGTFMGALPEIAEMCDFRSTSLEWIDCTYSARVDTESQARQVIDALKHVSNRQLRASTNSNDTTAYWNKSNGKTQAGRHKELKAYLKFPEFMAQLKSLRKQYASGDKSQSPLISVMENDNLQKFAENLIRFEGRAKQRFLERMNIPKNVFDAINYQKQFEKTNKQSLIQYLWSEMFKDLFEALDGQKMKVYSDEQVLNKLRIAYQRFTPKGNVSYSKADKIYGFYRRITNEGYQNVYRTMASSTFDRQLKDLMSIGFSKAQLQNMSSDESNVIPLIQVVNVDFAQQRPAWYVEPESTYGKLFELRSVA
jgi:II/X family phage/plasmid replication protein